MRKTLTFGVLLVLLFAPTASASDGWLSKREARREALRFTAPFVDLLDMDRTVETVMVPPRKCRRVSRRTVSCGVSAYLEANGRTLRGAVRVRRQGDGLLGFMLPAFLSP